MQSRKKITKFPKKVLYSPFDFVEQVTLRKNAEAARLLDTERAAVQKGVLDIWYVLYCPNQKEEDLLYACKQHLTGAALKDAFVFTYDRMRRYGGAWHLERQLLFPHYLFLESKDEEELAEELKRYSPVFSVFESGGKLIRVEPEEEELLRMLCGEGHHSQMSRGYIRDGQTVVTEGPLRGRENLIRRIDRHKRIARVGMPSAGRLREMQVGLEIVSKS